MSRATPALPLSSVSTNSWTSWGKVELQLDLELEKGVDLKAL